MRRSRRRPAVQDLPPGGNPPETVRKITVSLVPGAAASLDLVRGRSGHSTTDIVNRAVSLYEFTDAEIRDGAQIIVRKDGHDWMVRLL